MKKIFRKSMLVLFFLGLFVFVAPIQAITEPTPDRGPQVFCADYECENGFSGTICGPNEAAVYKKNRGDMRRHYH